MVGAWCLVLGAWCLVLGAWCLVLGAWCLVLGAWCLVLGAWWWVRGWAGRAGGRVGGGWWVVGGGWWVVGGGWLVGGGGWVVVGGRWWWEVGGSHDKIKLGDSDFAPPFCDAWVVVGGSWRGSKGSIPPTYQDMLPGPRLCNLAVYPMCGVTGRAEDHGYMTHYPQAHCKHMVGVSLCRFGCVGCS